jgi:hypothetical protein
MANEDVTLSSFRGRKNVVLVFYPLAFSGVCTRQLTQINQHGDRYSESDAQVLGRGVALHRRRLEPEEGDSATPHTSRKLSKRSVRKGYASECQVRKRLLVLRSATARKACVLVAGESRAAPWA